MSKYLIPNVIISPVCETGMITPFIHWLVNMDLIDFSMVADDTNVGFDTRFRIQKYVFLAQYLGLDTKYGYNRYRYGPYSPKLAKEYYRLAEDSDAYKTESKGRTSEGFRSDDFLDAVANRDEEWLEVATTLIDLSPQHDSPCKLIAHVKWIKDAYSKKYIGGVLDDLHRSPLTSAVCH